MKKRLYFIAARYFSFFARLKLQRWHPRIFVVTGSSGKTTTLHLLEAQFGSLAHFSHHANSAFGIPFDILGLRRRSLKRVEWLSLFLFAPIKCLLSTRSEKIYIAEVDCDRPGEGEFLGQLLQPEALIWLSSTQTHAKNFDHLVGDEYSTVEEAIAHEFGNLVSATTGVVIANADNIGIAAQLQRTKARIVEVTDDMVEHFHPSLDRTHFTIESVKCSVPALVPREVGLSVAAIKKLAEYAEQDFDEAFGRFVLPPGRSSVFQGKKDTILIDSTYNASLDAAEAMIELFTQLKADKKWLVISDILEQGRSEAAIHRRLAEAIGKLKADKIIVMGPRAGKHTAPVLDQLGVDYIAVDGPKQVLDVLRRNIKGGETILFKGTRFLEGVVEKLLADPDDAQLLCRREPVWQKRRKRFGI